MEYKRTEVIKKLNDETTLIYYKKKGKAYKIRFTFLCYFRLNIQKQCMFFQNTRVSNFKNE